MYVHFTAFALSFSNVMKNVLQLEIREAITSFTFMLKL
jgi:hypothetical protein